MSFDFCCVDAIVNLYVMGTIGGSQHTRIHSGELSADQPCAVPTVLPHWVLSFNTLITPNRHDPPMGNF